MRDVEGVLGREEKEKKAERGASPAAPEILRIASNGGTKAMVETRPPPPPSEI